MCGVIWELKIKETVEMNEKSLVELQISVEEVENMDALSEKDIMGEIRYGKYIFNVMNYYYDYGVAEKGKRDCGVETRPW